jgi:hypothetical protein
MLDVIKMVFGCKSQKNLCSIIIIEAFHIMIKVFHVEHFYHKNICQIEKAMTPTPLPYLSYATLHNI